MKRRDDYSYMGSRSKNALRRVGRSDVERLLSGDSLADERLGRLQEIVEALGRAGGPAPSEEEIQRFASQAASQVPLGAVGSGARRAVRGGGVWMRRRRLVLRLAGASAAMMVVLSGLGGLAYAADGSVPGDSLYGVDLAFEKIGVGDGGVRERLSEAGQLVERGRVQEGIDLASDAIAQSADGDEALRAAAEALRAAAEAAIRNQMLQTSEQLGRTAEQLRKMASEETTAEELGQAVEELVGTLDPGQGSGSQDGGTGQDQGGSTGGTGSGGGGTGGQGTGDPVEGSGATDGAGSGGAGSGGGSSDNGQAR